VREQIAKEICGPGFGELAGTVQVQLDGRVHLPFHIHDQRDPRGGVHGICGRAKGRDVDVTASIWNALYLRSEQIGLGDWDSFPLQRQGSARDCFYLGKVWSHWREILCLRQ